MPARCWSRRFTQRRAVIQGVYGAFVTVSGLSAVEIATAFRDLCDRLHYFRIYG